MRKFVIFSILLLVVIGIPVSKKYFKSEGMKEVETELVSTHTIKASILASGQLKHEEEIKLTSEVIGRVSKLHIQEGDSVSRGQLVLEIDDETFAASVEQQQAAVDQQRVAIEKQMMVVDNLKKQWKRKTQLFNQKLLDTDAYDAITHQYQVAKVDLKASRELLKQVEARLDQARDQLSKTKIVSPIDGVVTSLDIKEGETAISSTTNIAGSSLMTIANPQSMLAEINVDEADIANVQLGQQAEIIAISFADTPLVGQVESIASSAKRALGRQSYSFAVKLKLAEDNQLNLRPGMSCRAEVFTQGEQALLAVPIKAVQTVEDNDNDLVENFVFIASEGVAKKTPIKAGISDDNFQQILEGIQHGATIITGPDKVLRHLRDGDKIKIIELTPNTASL
ncbi:efflux RND transporter periplasmic adaptor subunit [Aliikangiella marina]|uniref:Efflux RND transporter periplasmic adaptor subunit n=1 Tax=Aliikangiella marina TaxID=1712262 RepID=A0A545TDZ6_9GAMM|nr:efflux RND transporter periplasmic adaptor subunit [Aliikangiella marina]TQV75447.1 efflux RND transporter periplasmic adaptor subunit [Aliikangiella marina]